ncbi:amino acid permease [Corynebacterium epidermidicanis]|uniref:Transporter, basic amino acid/polyamine antiporter (APA) family n=1 Tax=Corynebacterium epidermidicanis TaxID=1050174 RepID=A0A0G3GT80_9CORY|nr:amino acid permease [Corynebacterium epidermidicanis]AKK02733.1 transporter, basic amino acid/polyamine antiporter (APA) family [Corynebacterium epidermidicanis]
MTEQKSTNNTVSLWTLVSLIIGSTVGAGIFALPQNAASVAAPGAMLIGWAIAGIGMLSIAFVFQVLALRKPHLDSGVYSYVRAGLGDFVGFASAWGYWLGSVIAQVGYATLFFSTLGHYIPFFSTENRWTSGIAVSILTWVIFFMLTRGIQQAALMNVVTTVAKILPILAFIILVAFLGFSWDKFTLDIWGRNGGSGSVMDQIKAFMLFTVWTFIGVEGASVYSKQSRTRRDVGRATVIGFFSVLALLVTVTTLSFGVMTQEELAGLSDNSLAAVLEHVVGPWGGALVSLGLMFSVLGAYVSWQMLCAEPILLMGIDGLLPARFGRVNRAGAPVAAQLVSTIVIQICVVVFFMNEATYSFMVQLATIMYMLPYVFSALYLVLLATRGRGMTHPHAGTRFDDSGPVVSASDNRRHLLIGAVALVYSLWLFYAADPRYLLLGCLLVVPGLIPYVWTRIKSGDRIFNTFEWVVVALVILGSCYAIYGLTSGTLSFA